GCFLFLLPAEEAVAFRSCRPPATARPLLRARYRPAAMRRAALEPPPPACEPPPRPVCEPPPRLVCVRPPRLSADGRVPLPPDAGVRPPQPASEPPPRPVFGLLPPSAGARLPRQGAHAQPPPRRVRPRVP